MKRLAPESWSAGKTSLWCHVVPPSQVRRTIPDITDGPTIFGIQEVDRFKYAFSQLELYFPRVAAVASRQDVRPGPNGPAPVTVDKPNTPQVAYGPGVLHGPRQSAVRRGQHKTAVAHNPTTR